MRTSNKKYEEIFSTQQNERYVNIGTFSSDIRREMSKKAQTYSFQSKIFLVLPK